MHVTGPFRDKKKRAAGSPRTWYLRVVAPRLNADGTPLIDELGRVRTRRERPFYETKEQAVADIPRLSAQHEAGGVVSTGIISREGLMDYERAKAEVPEVALYDLAKFWRIHHPRDKKEVIENLVPVFLAELKARNAAEETRHYGDLKSRLSHFCTAFGARLPTTLTRGEILTYLLKLGKAGRTVLNHKRAIHNFFGWLLEKEIILANPASGIKNRQLPKFLRKEITFLSVDETRRYLRALERYDPGLVAHEAIQLFSGVRADDEMADFLAEWVMPATREIIIPAAAAKMKRRDVISGLEENFWTWWETYGPKQGPLRPKNYMQRWRRVRILSNIDEQSAADEIARISIKVLRKQEWTKPALGKWPWTARRRTFCTYHVAKHQSADRTALILRHKGMTSILHESYRGLGVTKQQGAAFFDLLPQKVAQPIPPPKRVRGNKSNASVNAS